MQLLLARAYAGTGDLRAAAEILARLVSGSHARRADAHYEFGRVLLAQGEAEGSLRAFREAHRLDAEFEPASEAIRAAEERKAREERAAPRLGGLHAVPE